MTKDDRDKNQLIAIAKDIVFNENETATARLSGVKILIEDCCLSIAKQQHGLKRLYIVEKNLVDKLIQEYRDKRVIEFMQKYGTLTNLTPDMVIEMKRIDKPAHCYKVEGITVIENDCNLCKKRSCEISGETLQYKLDEEEELTERLTDGLE